MTVIHTSGAGNSGPARISTFFFFFFLEQAVLHPLVPE
jgi:hypothetical protein